MSIPFRPDRSPVEKPGPGSRICWAKLLVTNDKDKDKDKDKCDSGLRRMTNVDGWSGE